MESKYEKKILNCLLIMLSIIILIIIYYKLNYIYTKGEYYIDGLIYSAKDSTLLTGTIIDFEEDSYSKILNVENGLLVGEYKHDYEVYGISDELYLSNDIDIKHFNQILKSYKVNISIDTDNFTSLNVILIVQDTGFYNKPLTWVQYSNQAKLIHKYLNNKYKLKIITFYFKDQILNNTKVKYLTYSFNNDSLIYFD